MQSYVALLRGINVGGNRKVSMAELKAQFIDLGCKDVQTLLQSGNVAFQTATKPTELVERDLETAFKARFGLEVDFLVRTAEELDALIAANPFPQEAENDPSHLLVMFLKSATDARAVKTVREAWNGPEYFQASSKEIYAVFPAGIGDSKLLTFPAWKKFAGLGTGRNWNTVLKLASLARN